MSQAGSPRDHEDWLAIIDEGLRKNPDTLPLLLDRAVTLSALGRIDEAEETLEVLLQYDPQDYRGLTQRGQMLAKRKKFDEALKVYQELLRLHPEDAVAHTHVGFLFAIGADFATARTHYERALELSPQNRQAHIGLSLVLPMFGQHDQAEIHQRLGKFDPGYFTLQYRGEGPPIPLLLLVSANEGSASMTFERILNDSIFHITKLVVEHFDPASPLPESTIIVNGICDAERAETALHTAKQLIENVSLPVVNRIDSLLLTSRAETARRLRDIPNVRTARTELVDSHILRHADREQWLAANNFHYPFLVRAPGFFAGRQFYRIENLADLDAALEAMGSATILLIEYIETRDELGFFRKFRTLFIDGTLYPLHLAISDSWKVHYFSANMSSNAKFRAIEEQFLNDHKTFLGPQAIKALYDIHAVMQLDYCGVDFGFEPDGTLVVFEANASMSLAKPGREEHWAYRRTAAAAIVEATERMLLERSVQPTIRV
jgi:tetratricopeptide (TPR) repeat protein